MKETLPAWLKWAREIQQLSQTGLAFAVTEYEKQRYEKLMDITSEILEQHTNLEKQSVKKIIMEQPGYATPKVDVRAAVIDGNGKILLVQEKSDLRWAMPGGWADVGDIPSDVAVREAKEESGFDVNPVKLIGVFDANRVEGQLEFFHAFKIVFLCELKGGTARASDETIAADFFRITELPALSHNRTNQKHIDEIVLHLKNPARAAYFD